MDAAGFMRRALALAERGRATCSPNPLVGCVLARDGEVVGEGWHEHAGGPHAEVMAVASAGDRARGSVAYVTLEPCNHEGRTEPCAPVLVEAGVSRVVAAVADPNPRAAGGAEALRAAGVPVQIGLCEADARRQNEVFFHAVTRGRPLVIAKAAVSLDGRIAAADGTSQWLTGPAARRHAHRLRADVDAVVVGSGTVLADDPRMTARLDGERVARQPLRVVLDGRARAPRTARVFDGAAPTLWCVTEPVDAPAGGDVEVLPARDPKAVLEALWRRDVRSVLVEGGAAVLSSFLDAGLCDRLVVHVAPLLLGETGRPVRLGGPVTLADATRYRLESAQQAGDDALLTYREVT